MSSLCWPTRSPSTSEQFPPPTACWGHHQGQLRSGAFDWMVDTIQFPLKARWLGELPVRTLPEQPKPEQPVSRLPSAKWRVDSTGLPGCSRARGRTDQCLPNSSRRRQSMRGVAVGVTAPGPRAPWKPCGINPPTWLTAAETRLFGLGLLGRSDSQFGRAIGLEWELDRVDIQSKAPLPELPLMVTPTSCLAAGNCSRSDRRSRRPTER